MSQPVVQYSWDPDKALLNFRKHRVSFDEAVGVFEDPEARILADPDHSEDEQRDIIIGYSLKGRLLYVSYHERQVDIIRIISARLATKEERRQHEQKDH